MSITYPLTLPTAPAPKNVEWLPRSVVAATLSPFTMQQQVQAHQGQMWEVKFALPSMTDASARAWIATILALNGRQGTFLFGDSVLKAPRGSAGGTPLVNGASQTGQALITDGWPTSINGVLLKGDWIQLGTGATQRVYSVLNDVNSNGSGQATIDIWPRLRESPADNAALTLTATKMTMRLKDNKMDWSVNTAKHYGFEIEAVEAI